MSKGKVNLNNPLNDKEKKQLEECLKKARWTDMAETLGYKKSKWVITYIINKFARLAYRHLKNK